MIRCPHCQRLNDEMEVVCIICSASLENAETVRDVDADDEWRKLWLGRQEKFRREAIFPSVVYVLVIVLLVAMSGGTSIELLLLYMASAIIVALAVGFKYAGQFRAALLQAALSGMLAIYVGPFNPLFLFMLGAHVFLAVFFVIWIQISSDMR